MAFTKKDLKAMVDDLNKKHKLDDNTDVKFAVATAYGGTKVVLTGNDKKRYSGATDVTQGFQSSKETAFDLLNKNPSYIKEDIAQAKMYANEANERAKQAKYPDANKKKGK